MKKLLASFSLVLVVALGVVGFAGCKKKAKAEPNPMNAYVGTWRLTRIEYWDENGVYEENSVLDNEPLYQMNPDELDDDERQALGLYITLNADGTYESTLWFLPTIMGLEGAIAAKLYPEVVYADNVKNVKFDNQTWTANKDQAFVNGILSWDETPEEGETETKSMFFNEVFSQFGYAMTSVKYTVEQNCLKVNIVYAYGSGQDMTFETCVVTLKKI